MRCLLPANAVVRGRHPVVRGDNCEMRYASPDSERTPGYADRQVLTLQRVRRHNDAHPFGPPD
jgi:hypothetical protein